MIMTIIIYFENYELEIIVELTVLLPSLISIYPWVPPCSQTQIPFGNGNNLDCIIMTQVFSEFKQPVF